MSILLRLRLMIHSNLQAVLYVLSGVCQPLLVTLLKAAQLADPNAQLYMFFYYLGPAFLAIGCEPPPRDRALQAIGIALFDCVATSLNYTGASLAGPTLFGVVYASVTVWTAVFARCWWKHRTLSYAQWAAIGFVFGGLLLTTLDSVQLGPHVVQGTLLILLGSCWHAWTYVWSEAVMEGPHGLTIRQNTAVQAVVAVLVLGFWQVVYTIPHWQPLSSGVSWWSALCLLMLFAMVNLLHSVSFYHVLKHFPGGATSAGVLKGLQAVLVFVAAHVCYCGRTYYGGSELCFSFSKLCSLLTVVGGVTWFGIASDARRKQYRSIDSSSDDELEAPLS